MTAVETINSEVEELAGKETPKTTHALVVATDGSHAADAAFTAARLIEEKTRCRVYVLSVLEPLPVLIPMADSMLVTPEAETQRAAAMHDLIDKQTRRFNPEGTWGIEVRMGTPAQAISRFARQHQAAMVVVGASKHGLWGRMLGEETAMSIARFIELPLLVASHDLNRLPKRVMVAMDIKPFGLEAAADAISVVGDTRTVSCVHVKPRAELMGIDWAEFDQEYELAMQERFSVIEKSLRTAGLRADLVVKHGDVSREIAEFAEFSKAELVVVGINRRPGKMRATRGRLAGRMLRYLKSSLLIVPSRTQPLIHHGLEGRVTDVFQDPKGWSAATKGFTARNAGRICTLEIDDPEIGAQVEAHSYPLVGVDYDHKDGRLTIILGETSGMNKHLTRSVTSPESISILSIEGRDTALSVVHAAGQTLMTF